MIIALVPVQPINVPDTLTALAGLVVALTGLGAMFMSLRAQIKNAIAVSTDNNKKIGELHKTVNSQQTAADLERKNRADEKELIAVRLATLEAEKIASEKSDTAFREFSTKMLDESAKTLAKFHVDAEQRRLEAIEHTKAIADLKAQLAAAMIACAVKPDGASVTPTEVTVVKVDPIPVRDIPSPESKRAI